MRRLPAILATVAATAALLLLGPVAAAVLLLRSSSDAHGPTLAAHLLIAGVVLAIAAFAGLLGWGLGLLLKRFAGRR